MREKNRMCHYTIVVATANITIGKTVVTISVIPCRVVTVVTTIVTTVVTTSVIPRWYKSVVTIVVLQSHQISLTVEATVGTTVAAILHATVGRVLCRIRL